MLSDILKQQTRDVHLDLEKEFIRELKKINSKEKYIAFLSLLYGFYHGLEESMDLPVSVMDIPHMSRRRKAGWLLKDINALGGAHVQNHSFSNTFDTPAEVIGALYVAEGSTLGGTVIAGMLSRHDFLHGNMGLSFFRGYESDTMVMWQSFQQFLNSEAATNYAHSEVITGAIKTFTSFKHWIQQHASN